MKSFIWYVHLNSCNNQVFRPHLGPTTLPLKCWWLEIHYQVWQISFPVVSCGFPWACSWIWRRTSRAHFFYIPWVVYWILWSLCDCIVCMHLAWLHTPRTSRNDFYSLQVRHYCIGSRTPFLSIVHFHGFGEFQKNNATANTSILAIEWFQEYFYNCRYFNSSTKTPSFNIIEHIWDVFQSAV